MTTTGSVPARMFPSTERCALPFFTTRGSRTVEPLPDIPPGTPPSGKMLLTLNVVRETEKAIQVTRNRWDERCGRAWLPKAAVRRRDPNNFGGDERIELPLWLYQRAKEQL